MARWIFAAVMQQSSGLIDSAFSFPLSRYPKECSDVQGVRDLP